jgi:hypothetical protein
VRLWTVHPKYLDAKGLVALWREALLAKKVLENKTVGYRNHPQLIRFKEHDEPVKVINAYLNAVYCEADQRGYNFDKGKFKLIKAPVEIIATKGQLEYETEHLLKKLKERDIKKYQQLKVLKNVEAHPLFKITKGEVASWEIR